MKQICVEASKDKYFDGKIVMIPCDIDLQIHSVQSEEDKQLKVLRKSKFFQSNRNNR